MSVIYSNIFKLMSLFYFFSNLPAVSHFKWFIHKQYKSSVSQLFSCVQRWLQNHLTEFTFELQRGANRNPRHWNTLWLRWQAFLNEVAMRPFAPTADLGLVMFSSDSRDALWSTLSLLVTIDCASGCIVGNFECTVFLSVDIWKQPRFYLTRRLLHIYESRLSSVEHVAIVYRVLPWLLTFEECHWKLSIDGGTNGLRFI